MQWRKGKEKERALGSSVMDGVAEELLRRRIMDAVRGRLKSVLIAHCTGGTNNSSKRLQIGPRGEPEICRPARSIRPPGTLIGLYLIRGIDAAAWSRMTRTTFGGGRHQRDRANATSKFPQSPIRQQHRNNNGLLMEKSQHTRIVGEETGPPSSFLGWYNAFTWVLDPLFCLQLAQSLTLLAALRVAPGVIDKVVMQCHGIRSMAIALCGRIIPLTKR
jgi:hypothetical protein